MTVTYDLDTRAKRFDPMKDAMELYCDTIYEASKHGKSVRKVYRQLASQPNERFFSLIGELAWECIAAREAEISESIFSDRHTITAEVAMLPKSTTSYCVLLTYRSIDACVSALPPTEALFRINALQGELGRVQEYASKCISQIAHHAFSHPNAITPVTSYVWIEEAISLDRDGNKERSLDIIFDNLDELLLASKFSECDFVLASAPADRLSNAQLLTILTATAPASVHLSARALFFDRTRAILNSRGANADEVLVGLG